METFLRLNLYLFTMYISLFVIGIIKCCFYANPVPMDFLNTFCNITFSIDMMLTKLRAQIENLECMQTYLIQCIGLWRHWFAEMIWQLQLSYFINIKYRICIIVIYLSSLRRAKTHKYRTIYFCKWLKWLGSEYLHITHTYICVYVMYILHTWLSVHLWIIQQEIVKIYDFVSVEIDRILCTVFYLVLI